MPQKTALEIKNLSKSYADVLAVDQINISFKAGEISVLLGLNGAGKTTTLKMMAGLLQPSFGEIFIQNEKVIWPNEQSKNLVGALLADMSLYYGLSALENFIYFGKLRGISVSDIKKRLDEIEPILNINDLLHRRFGLLSSGQQRKLMIANTILHDPPVLIFDEVTANLDISATQYLITFLNKEKERGKAIIFSTHIMSEAELLADQVFIIHQGKIIERGSVDEILKRNEDQGLTKVFLKLINKYENTNYK